MRRLRGLQDVDFSSGSASGGISVPLRVGQVVDVEDKRVADLLIERGMAELAGEDPAPADDARQGSEAPATKTTKKAAKKTTKKK